MEAGAGNSIVRFCRNHAYNKQMVLGFQGLKEHQDDYAECEVSCDILALSQQ